MKRLLITVPLMVGLGACGVAEKAEQLKAQADELQAEYEAFNLACDFDDITAESEVESSALAGDEDDAAEACEDAAEQYSILVEKFDTDADGDLSDDELAEAQAGWEDAQVSEMDADEDGKVADGEKDTWRSQKLPARKEKLQTDFDEACKALDKDADECGKLRDGKKDKIRDKRKEREAEFDKDKDGKLSDEERKAMNDALKTEREGRRDDFRKEHDKDGDGKLGPDEHKASKDNRDKKKEEKKGPGPKPA